MHIEIKKIMDYIDLKFSNGCSQNSYLKFLDNLQFLSDLGVISDDCYCICKLYVSECRLNAIDSLSNE